MPENQISLSNLARVIGDLKQQKESPRKEQPKPMPNTRSRQPPQTSYNRDSFNPKSLLGAPPSGGFSGRFSESAQRPNTALKNKPDGLKVNLITSGPPRGQQMTYDDRSYRKSDDFYNEPLYHAVNRAHDDNPSYARSNYKAGQSSR
uniref:Uncharacterized protein n=1 Tax=Ciona savignyi TaxID=51511 RepID=H2Z649_CIOSA